jgi:hypothetical protein
MVDNGPNDSLPLQYAPNAQQYLMDMKPRKRAIVIAALALVVMLPLGMLAGNSTINGILDWLLRLLGLFSLADAAVDLYGLMCFQHRTHVYAAPADTLTRF